MTVRIIIASSYSRSPAGRLRSDGPYSGERFRDEVLLPALTSSSEPVEVDLNGVLGFGSSFLEEAFGGLVRSGRFTFDELRSRLRILTDIQSYDRRIWSYVKSARPA